MRRRTIVVAFVALLGFALGAPVAQADIIVVQGNVPQIDENILFNEPGLMGGPSNLVTGITNTSGFIVNFVGDEPLVTPSGGQARVEGADGDFTAVDVSLASGLFTSYIVNVNVESGASGTVQFTVDEFGTAVNTVSSAFTVGVGQNFFTVTAINGQLIESVLLVASGDIIMDIRQNRIGGAQNPPTTGVPEPATLLLVGAALAGIAAAARRRRAKK